MNKTVFLFLGFFLISTALSIQSCGHKSGHHHEVVQDGPEYTSDYVCPMHCDGSGSDEPGTCPVCGMDYVQLTEHQADGHEHEVHEDHQH